MAPTTTEQEWLSEATTPSGIEIRFGVKPKRVYQVRLPDSELCESILCAQAGCSCWFDVPSVTTVLDVLKKDGLHWWGMKVGVAGVLELWNLGVLIDSWGTLALEPDEGQYVQADEQGIIDLLTKHKLTVNHVRDKAGDRGTAVHDAFELWAKNGTEPNPEHFPEEQRGYIHALLAFLHDVQPEPLDTEVMVGSAQHGFAGRYDIRFKTTEKCEVVYHNTPKRGAKRALLAPGFFLGDLKTSSGTYLSHHLQLAAYEGASIECGYEPTSAQGIIHVNQNGTYEFVRSHGTLEDFLAVKHTADTLNDLARRAKK